MAGGIPVWMEEKGKEMVSWFDMLSYLLCFGDG